KKQTHGEIRARLRGSWAFYVRKDSTALGGTMHYLLVADRQGDHVLFRGARETLEEMAAKLRRELPGLRIRITRHAVDLERRAHVDVTDGKNTWDVRAEGWVAPRTG